MSAQKARRVSDLIREIPYEDALTILKSMPYRASYPIWKLIDSAAAGKSHEKDELIINRIEVNEGPTKKKLKPQAQGRSCLIKRSTCHITVRFNNINNNAPFSEYRFLRQALREILRRLREQPETKTRKPRTEPERLSKKARFLVEYERW